MELWMAVDALHGGVVAQNGAVESVTDSYPITLFMRIRIRIMVKREIRILITLMRIRQTAEDVFPDIT
jgi:hypothetical protein